MGKNLDFHFTNTFNLSKVDEIVEYLRGPRLWIAKNAYPDFDEWAQKVQQELKKEAKHALVCFSGQNIAGVVLYQRHKTFKDTLEIKNLTVRPDVRGRHIADFLLRNAEIQGVRDFKSQFVICDAKTKNFPVRNFLFHSGYLPVTVTDLYGLGAGDDMIFRKNLLLIGRS